MERMYNSFLTQTKSAPYPMENFIDNAHGTIWKDWIWQHWEILRGPAVHRNTTQSLNKIISIITSAWVCNGHHPRSMNRRTNLSQVPADFANQHISCQNHFHRCETRRQFATWTCRLAAVSAWRPKVWRRAPSSAIHGAVNQWHWFATPHGLCEIQIAMQMSHLSDSSRHTRLCVASVGATDVGSHRSDPDRAQATDSQDSQRYQSARQSSHRLARFSSRANQMVPQTIRNVQWIKIVLCGSDSD